MEDFMIRYCKLCLTTIGVENDFLFLKLGFDDDSKHEICNICSAKLSSAQKFKLTCSYTENAISSFTNDTKVFPLDLREIYKNERGSEHISDDVNICRLCMQPINIISEFKPINEDQIDMVHTLVPEMDIFIVKEPVMCKPCLNSLAEHCDFLKKCSDIKQNTSCTVNVQVAGASSHPLSVAMPVKINDVMKFEEDLCQLIKAECENQNGSDINGKGIFSKATVYEKHETQTHILTHGNTSERQTYKCEDCNFETEYQFNLKKHKLIHEDPSKVQMYKCENGDYEAKFKEHLKTHMSAKMYRCDTCNFETGYKGNLKHHMLIHKDPSEVQMYKCENCDYETKFKDRLKRHMSIHEDYSQAKKYRCGTCNFKTGYKCYLKQHMLIHKDPSEVLMYKCENCNFETRFKEHLKRHNVSIHRDNSEAKMYRCETCNFVTGYKCNLKTHMLIHKDPSEVQMFKCENCNFETTREYYLKRHKIIHEDPSKVQMYQCKYCSYETKQQRCLKPHMLTHKDRSEVQMYRCESCNYEAKGKRYFKKHMLKHKDS